MKREFENSLRLFLVEFVLYGALVVGYYLLVLHYLGGWLYSLFESSRVVYSWVSLGLIVGQGIILDVVTKLLLALIKPRTEDR
jgi:hypothetical protein